MILFLVHELLGLHRGQATARIVVIHKNLGLIFVVRQNEAKVPVKIPAAQFDNPEQY